MGDATNGLAVSTILWTCVSVKNIFFKFKTFFKWLYHYIPRDMVQCGPHVFGHV